MTEYATLEDISRLRDELTKSDQMGLHGVTVSNADIRRLLARDDAFQGEIKRLAENNSTLASIINSHQAQSEKYREALVAACALLDIQYEGSHQLAVAITAVACHVDTPGNWLTIKSNIDRMRREAN